MDDISVFWMLQDTRVMLLYAEAALARNPDMPSLELTVRSLKKRKQRLEEELNEPRARVH